MDLIRTYTDLYDFIRIHMDFIRTYTDFMLPKCSRAMLFLNEQGRGRANVSRNVVQITIRINPYTIV